MDLKACSRCGKIHPRNYNCTVGRIYQKTDESKLRSRYAWTKKAKQIKNDDKGLCLVCKAQGVYTYDNLEVHHITKVRDDESKLLDDDNLITLCVYHHKLADAGEINAEYLRKLVAERGK